MFEKNAQRDLRKWTDRLNIEAIFPTDDAYDDARRIYNRLHDLRPAALLRTRDPSAIAQILAIARDQDVEITVRGGGHHVAGFGSCDGGIVLDFSRYRSVAFEKHAATVAVDPGAQLCDVDRFLWPMGLVVPLGTVSCTGIAGLTLGGGIGWLVGRYGLTCDSLIGADVVLADGRQVRAEDPEHARLLWALRGAGHGFGVVTCFRYRPSNMIHFVAGSGRVPFDTADDALSALFSFLLNVCPPELTVAPILFRDSTGCPWLSVDFCLTGNDESALDDLQGLLKQATWNIRRDDDYVAWQSSLDASFTKPMRWYSKARYDAFVTDQDIGIMLEAFTRAPGPESVVLIEHLHGKLTQIDPAESAFPLRSTSFGIVLSARWHSPVLDHTNITWVRDTILRLDPHIKSMTYSNYALVDDERAARTLGIAQLKRLLEAKGEYDPQNIFTRNHLQKLL